MVLVSIIVGLGIATLLTGIASLIRSLLTRWGLRGGSFGAAPGRILPLQAPDPVLVGQPTIRERTVDTACGLAYGGKQAQQGEAQVA
jgi:hypothetical protein